MHLLSGALEGSEETKHEWDRPGTDLNAHLPSLPLFGSEWLKAF